MVNLWPVNSNNMSGKTHNLIFEILGSHQAAPVTRCSTFLIKNLHDWKMEPSRFSFHLDCSCTANVIPAYWLFHMTGSSKCAISAYTRDTTSTLLCPAGLCIMIAASIYTAKFHVDDSEGGYGHSYVLAWIAFVFSLLLAITYLVLRKKSEWVREWKTTSTGKRSGGGVKPCIGFPVWFFWGRDQGGRGRKDRGSFTIWEE